MEITLNTNTSAGQEDATKSVWQCPTISRIDIKRTLIGTGSNQDAIHGPSPS